MTTNAISPDGRRSARGDTVSSSDTGRQPTTQNSGSAHCGLPQIDYFVLSMPCFAARGWLRINLLCVLGEVIPERVADLVHGV
jgi:hypothetical protein